MKKIFYSVCFILSFFVSISSFAQSTDSDSDIKKAMIEQATQQKTQPSTIIKAEDSPAYKIYSRVVSKVALFSGKVADVLDNIAIFFIPLLLTGYIGVLTIKAYISNQSISSFLSQQIGFFAWAIFMLGCYIAFEKYAVDIFKIFSLISVEVLKLADSNFGKTDAEIKYAFKLAYDMYINLLLVTDEVWDLLGDDWTDYLSHIGILFATGFLMFIYFGVYLAFTFLWSLNTVAFFIFVAFGKVVIVFAMFPKLKGYFWNWFEALIGFGVTLIFVACAMAMTTFILGDTFEVANQYVKAEEITLLYTELALVGVFSWFFHIKAPTFASMLLKSHVSDFGQTFATSASMAGALGKTLGKKGLALGSKGVVSGASKVADWGKKYLGQ
tara:strand:- start:4864 stop:6015 length:1152 start_codon:yes stop_codon:yes gene_type:complete